MRERGLVRSMSDISYEAKIKSASLSDFFDDEE